MISNNIAVVKALLEAGAKVDTKDVNQRSPLDMAQSRLDILKKKSTRLEETSSSCDCKEMFDEVSTGVSISICGLTD